MIKYNIKYLISNNFCSIPEEILRYKRLCLWKYEYNKNKNSKALKIPYGIDVFGFIHKSLKNQDDWFNYKEIHYINQKDHTIFGLGVILNNSPYICIDIDNCIRYKNDSYYTCKEVHHIIESFPEAYCEISPSEKGLHIILKGLWSCSRERCLDKLHTNLNLEVYSGKSCRFITLTGKRIISRKNNLICEHKKIKIGTYSFDSQAIQNIYLKFFTNALEKQRNLNKSKNLIDVTNHIEKVKHYINANQQYRNQYNYLRLNKIAKSDSEDDYRFCLFILNHIPSYYKNKVIENILIYFLSKERLYRKKLERLDYVKRTIKVSIQYGRENNLIGTYIHSNNSPKKLHTISLNQLVKICN